MVYIPFRTIRMLLDPTAAFDENKRHWKVALFDQNGVPVDVSGSDPVEFVTALPTEPTDGDEIFLLARAVRPFELWNLVYNQAVDRWLWKGGTALSHVVASQEGTTQIVLVDLTTVGPTLTVPFAGDYLASFGAYMENIGSAAGSCFINLFVNGVSAPGTVLEAMSRVLQHSYGTASTNNVRSVHQQREYELTNLQAGDVLKMVYSSQLGTQTATFGRRRMTLRPIALLAP